MLFKTSNLCISATEKVTRTRHRIPSEPRPRFVRVPANGTRINCEDMLRFPRSILGRVDSSHRFPTELYDALAHQGWLGICLPQRYGGSELGISEAAVMMQTISESGAGMTGASSVHMNIFGLEPVAKFGSDEQRERWLPLLIAGRERACFGVTEPNTGLETLRLQSTARRSGDEYVLSGQKIWISTAQQAHKILILARTTPRDQVQKPTQGYPSSTLIYKSLNSRLLRLQKWDELLWIPILYSLMTGKCQYATV
ncbi:hypothetical protein N7488_010637 [Penicillium malachiteum]|nr:hypothetical protein N7488_010637 [Penicillium malachiteum]